MKERNILIDNIKSILIILVVLGHFGSSGSVIYNTFIIFIFSFHMPLFLFISGYLSKNVEKCRKKAMTEYLLLFIIAQLLWVLYKVVVEKDFYYFFNMLEPGFGLWYILSIFVYRILLKDLVRIKHIVIISAVASVLIMTLVNIQHFLDIQRIVGFLVYFLIGYYTDENTINKIKKIPPYLAAIGLGAVFAVFYIILDKKILNYGFFLRFLEHQAAIYDFSNIFIGLAIYIFIIPASLLIGSLVIAMIPRKEMWFTYIGEDTLPLYLSHTYGVALYREFLREVVIDSNSIAAFIVLCSCICIVLFSSKVYRKKFHFCKDKIVTLITGLCKKMLIQ